MCKVQKYAMNWVVVKVCVTLAANIYIKLQPNIIKMPKKFLWKLHFLTFIFMLLPTHQLRIIRKQWKRLFISTACFNVKKFPQNFWSKAEKTHHLNVKVSKIVFSKFVFLLKLFRLQTFANISKLCRIYFALELELSMIRSLTSLNLTNILLIIQRNEGFKL